MTQTWSILLAAGQGSRLRPGTGGISKQFLPCRGLPLFWRPALTLAAVPEMSGLVFVFPVEELDQAAQLTDSLALKSPLGLPYKIVAGGEERQDSVWNGLAALPPECSRVLVHDAARPFVGASLARRVLDALEAGHSGVVPGLTPDDTIKQVNAEGLALHTLPRSDLRYIQTPQGFARAALEKAHRLGREKGLRVTDDASLLEAAGIPVLVVPGEAGNRKITRPEDLEFLRAPEVGQAGRWAGWPGGMRPCIGCGYDAHRYGGDKPCRLGGVLIESTDISIVAHSDGDVLLHALTDALLGCAAAGDLGAHFPDHDPRYAGINSAVLLSEALEMVLERGIILGHVDMTLVAEFPKIGPFRAAIVKNVAGLLRLEERQVNLKATTEEGMGFTGAGLGIKALAVVSGLSPL